MVNNTKQKQQQKQQLQSLLHPELATLDTPVGGLLIIFALTRRRRFSLSHGSADFFREIQIERTTVN